MFFTGLDLEVFYHSDDSQLLDQIEIKYSLQTVCDKRIVTFYNISTVSPWLDENDSNRPYARILSDNCTYIGVLTPEETKAKIERHIASSMVIFTKT